MFPSDSFLRNDGLVQTNKQGIQTTIEQTFIYGQSFHIITSRYANTHIHTHAHVEWFESVLRSKGRRLQQRNEQLMTKTMV